MFISTKSRKHTKDSFCFVRFMTISEAERAITEGNDFLFQGKKISVAMAKYDRNGSPVSPVSPPRRVVGRQSNVIRKPAFRDEREYAEVVAGTRNQKLECVAVAGTRKQKHDGVDEKLRQKINGRKVEKEDVIPVSKWLKVSENVKAASLLQSAIIVENTDIFVLPHILSRITEAKVNETEIFSLSPTKLLITFGCEIDAKNAVSMDSLLWNMFDDIRMWSEGEFVDDRLVWIDCIGLHPLCYSMENLRKIGELWGPIIHIDNRVQGVERLTGARILLRTKAQNKIDNRIKIVYDHGSCDV